MSGMVLSNIKNDGFRKQVNGVAALGIGIMGTKVWKVFWTLRVVAVIMESRDFVDDWRVPACDYVRA